MPCRATATEHRTEGDSGVDLELTEPPKARILLWNTQWTTRRRPGAAWLADQVASWQPDMAVLTELESDLCDDWGGHLAVAGPNWGYHRAGRDRRKVVLWSKWPLVEVTRAEEHGLPEGRLVAATTDTPAGSVRVVAVCVPWRMAHVSTGRRDRESWEDHLSFLYGLRGFVDQQRAGGLPVVVAGDINQALSLTPGRSERYTALAQAVDVEGAPTRDLVGAHPVLQHAFGMGGLTPAVAEVVIAATHDTGRRLSDHDLVVVDMHRTGEARPLPSR